MKQAIGIFAIFVAVSALTPRLAHAGSANDIRWIYIAYTSANLNSADDGVYTIEIVHEHDVAGNVAGDDRDPNENNWNIEIR